METVKNQLIYIATSIIKPAGSAYCFTKKPLITETKWTQKYSHFLDFKTTVFPVNPNINQLYDVYCFYMYVMVNPELWML